MNSFYGLLEVYVKPLVCLAFIGAAALAAACSEPVPTTTSPTAAVTAASLDAQNNGAAVAVMDFGRDNIGSKFPPPSGHDESGHARDSLFPRTVTIDAGGTVTFRMGASGVHQVAVYQDGVQPEDINTSLLSPPAPPPCPPVPRINDPNRRIAVLSAQVCAGGNAAPTATFNQPGKYLVICTFLVHFVEYKMYGWVVVRDR